MVNEDFQNKIELVELDDYILRLAKNNSLLLIHKENNDVIIMNEIKINDVIELDKIDLKDKADLDLCIRFKNELEQKKILYNNLTTVLLYSNYIFTYSEGLNEWVSSYSGYNNEKSSKQPLSYLSTEFLNKVKEFFKNSMLKMYYNESTIIAADSLTKQIDSIIKIRLEQEKLFPELKTVQTNNENDLSEINKNTEYRLRTNKNKFYSFKNINSDINSDWYYFVNKSWIKLEDLKQVKSNKFIYKLLKAIIQYPITNKVFTDKFLNDSVKLELIDKIIS